MTPPRTSPRTLRVRSGREHALPIFLPVYQPRSPLVPSDQWGGALEVEGCILNAFFLYKQRDVRELFDGGYSIREHIGFDGFIMTDSGAFQGFTRRLHLDAKKIVAFQDRLGADVISPLDLVSPPGDNRATAAGKLKTTNKRIAKALMLASNSILAGVQQGGRFRDLRRESTQALVEMNVEYLALGSLVPFFNKNHDLAFVMEIIRDAREIAGPDLPIHVYGAGDPVEIPFLAAAGVDIFDSASYGHYAEGGWYMTPYGGVKAELFSAARELWQCPCPWCADGPERLYDDIPALASHNLWTILDTMRKVRAAVHAGTLEAMLPEVRDGHMQLFPDSLLGAST